MSSPAVEAPECAELRLAQQLFLLSTPDVTCDKPALLAAMQADIFEHSASPARPVSAAVWPASLPGLDTCKPDACLAPAGRVPVYLHICARLGLHEDAAKLEEMRAKNAQTLKELDERCATFGSAPPHHPACASRLTCTFLRRAASRTRRRTWASRKCGRRCWQRPTSLSRSGTRRDAERTLVCICASFSRCLVTLPSAGGRGGSCGDGEEGASPAGACCWGRVHSHTPLTPPQTVAVGHKMDLVFTALMLHLTFTDWLAVKGDIKKVRTGKVMSCHGAQSHPPADPVMPPPPTS